MSRSRQRKQLIQSINNHEEPLIQTICADAIACGYASCYSNLQDAWRPTVKLLSDALVQWLNVIDQPIRPGSTWTQENHAILQLGIQEAKNHRATGMPLSWFLGLLKCYRTAYLSLVQPMQLDLAAHSYLEACVHGFFDCLEIGTCEDWAAVDESEKLREMQQASRHATHEKNRLLNVLESLGVPLALTDHRGEMSYMNHAALALFMNASHGGHSYDGGGLGRIALLDRKVKSFFEGGSQSMKDVMQVDDRHYEVVLKSVMNGSIKHSGCVVILFDVTERTIAQERSDVLETAVECAHDMVVLTDASGVIEYVNQSFTQITGYDAMEAVGQRTNALKSGQHDHHFYDEMWHTIKCGKVWTGRLINRRKNGDLYPEEMTITPIRTEAGVTTHYIAIKRELPSDMMDLIITSDRVSHSPGITH